MRLICSRILLLLALGWFAPPPVARAQLAWDALEKTHEAKRGETNVVFHFQVTNQAAGVVIVKAVHPSCHCTVARLPSLPWRLKPGESGAMDVDVDVNNRWGQINKTIEVETSAGTNTLRVIVKMPLPTEREKNRITAFADRQAVFKADCANCHLKPAAGKTGAELYQAICTICHEAEHRAEMVPDLAKLQKPMDGAYWLNWIRLGKPGTFMPAFSKPFGGPLTEDQIASLIPFLSQKFPGSPSPAATTPPR